MRSRWAARPIRVDLKPAEAIPLGARLLNLPVPSAMVAASHHMQINLSRLGDGNIRTMVDKGRLRSHSGTTLLQL